MQPARPSVVAAFEAAQAFQSSHASLRKPGTPAFHCGGRAGGGIGAGASVMASFNAGSNSFSLPLRPRTAQQSSTSAVSPPRVAALAPASDDSSATGRAVAQGAFASVRVEMRPDGTAVAIKRYEHVVAAPGSERQLMHELHLANELKFAGKLRHPCVLAPDSVAPGPTYTELTMEYAPYGSLDDYTKRLKTASGMPEAMGQRAFSQLGSAIDYLHALSIVHRDIKLENLVLDGQWDARLIDFGAAQAVKKGDKLSVLQGTPAYMAPEVLLAAQHRQGLHGTGAFDPYPADVYAMGVCLFCLFNDGEIPFRGSDLQELIQNVRTAAIPSARRMPSAARELLVRLMAKAPSMRPTAALSMRQAWVQAGAQRPSASVSPRLGERPAYCSDRPATASCALPATNERVLAANHERRDERTHPGGPAAERYQRRALQQPPSTSGRYASRDFQPGGPSDVHSHPRSGQHAQLGARLGSLHLGNRQGGEHDHEFQPWGDTGAAAAAIGQRPRAFAYGCERPATAGGGAVSTYAGHACVATPGAASSLARRQVVVESEFCASMSCRSSLGL